jgi:alpha-ribazole phosphatase
LHPLAYRWCCTRHFVKIALVRHPSVSVAPGLCYGRRDLCLDADGLGAIPRMAASLRAFPTIWTSPARRCREVADAIGPAPRLDERLLELDFGDWEGMAWNDVPRDMLDCWAAEPRHFAPPGGETGAALLARVRSFHRTINDEGRDCAVIAHGGPLKLLGALLRGQQPDLLAAAPLIGSIEILSI